MKLLTTLSLAALLASASTAVFATGGGHGGKLIIMNDSKDAVAVGGELIVGSQSSTPLSSSGALLGFSGSRAHAGSVVVNGCPCHDKTIILNKSDGALAVGAATAGSVEINAGFGF